MVPLCMLFGATVAGLIAHHKNRNVIGWSIFGGLLFAVALLVLLTSPRKPRHALSDHMRRERPLATPPYYPPPATRRG